jgi:hypothetical protein
MIEKYLLHLMICWHTGSSRGIRLDDIYIYSYNFNYSQNDHNLCVIASNFNSNYYEVELKLDVLQS